MAQEQIYEAPVGNSSSDLLNRSSMNHTISVLLEQGYKLNLRRDANCLYCIELGQRFSPDSFNVDEYFQFQEGLSADESRTVFAISLDGGSRGYLVETLFVYEDNISLEMFQKLKTV